MSEGDDDYAALIYRESQLRKAEAAAAAAAAEKDAKKKKTSSSTSSTQHRHRATTSTRSAFAVVASKAVVNIAPQRKTKSRKKRSLATEGDEVPRKKYRYTCSADGCTNAAKKGGVCVKHGAKVKRCSSDGCTNMVVKGGVCKRHGAYHNPNDQSTAFASCFGSEFEKTTATYPNQRNSDSSSNQGSSPPTEVVLCKVVEEIF
jgi:hypothetical protein